MLRGREVPSAATLRSVGVASGDSIVTVRRELIAEGKHAAQLLCQLHLQCSLVCTKIELSFASWLFAALSSMQGIG